ncbi:LysM peptidoglycan-binding domain-containing protein [Lactiplantibacillus sp. DA1]|uniref:C40 family peptidase n=1 Tax=Lactiplantibacillus sp. DA1 TaxID=3079857 RepID=UPI00292A5F22|nr:LysM peptidoglycan-binding domain-containing protein [Lactiplantibacillus sp. DA1]MDV0430191.1 LysM peptidoglycan-binding domain-containing protein [Lactiplantibacillus sp. DA1]
MSQAHTTGKVLASTVGAVGLLLATGQAANAASITVKANDTVWGLAQQHGVSVKSIEKLNQIKASDKNVDLIYVGQNLQISESTTKTTTTKSATKKAAVKGTYTVKAGDTLWALADQYNTSVHALQTLNGLSGDLIVVGQNIQVPGATTKATAKTSQAATTPTNAVSATSATAKTATVASASSVSSASDTSRTSAASQDAVSADTASTTSSTTSTASAASSTATATVKVSATSASVSMPTSTTTSAASSTRTTSSSTANSQATSAATSSSVTSSVTSAASSTATSQSDTTTTSASNTATTSSASQSSTTPTSSASQSSSAATSSSSTTSQSNASAATSSASSSASNAATTNNSSTTTSSTSDLATGSVTGLALKLASANIPYVWGGASLSGMDCSGLVSYVYQHAAGITLPHSTVAQEAYVTTHSVADAQPGDILFWGNRGGTYHDAIYIGNNQYVAAPTEGENVQVQTISSYFMPSFAGTIK